MTSDICGIAHLIKFYGGIMSKIRFLSKNLVSSDRNFKDSLKQFEDEINNILEHPENNFKLFATLGFNNSIIAVLQEPDGVTKPEPQTQKPQRKGGK